MPRAIGSTNTSNSTGAAAGNRPSNSYANNGGTQKEYWDPWVCSFTGRMIAAPEVKSLTDGSQFCTFTVARQKGTKAFFHKCVAWGPVCKHIIDANPQKGDPVRVFVDVNEREYPDKENPEIKRYMLQWEVKEYHKRAASSKASAPVPGGDTTNEGNIE